MRLSLFVGVVVFFFFFLFLILCYFVFCWFSPICWNVFSCASLSLNKIVSLLFASRTYVCLHIYRHNGTYSSTLAWKLPWMEEPGGLQSMGSLRVGLDWATSLSLFTFMHWRRKWQPTSVFLPGESQGRGSLVGCRLWGRTELDMTETT